MCRRCVLSVLLASILLLAACSSVSRSDDAVVDITTTPSVTATMTFVPTATKRMESPTPTKTFTFTPSPTSSPTIPPPTATPEPATITPYPTLLPNQRVDYWMEKINLQDCELPCLLGITPGKSQMADVFRLFHPTYGEQWHLEQGQVAPDKYRFRIWFEEEEISEIQVGIIEDMDRISEIKFSIGYLHYINGLSEEKLAQAMKRYSLSQVISLLGQPDQVYIGLQYGRYEPDAPWPYEIWVVYDQVVITYAFSEIGIRYLGDTIQVCPVYRALDDIDIYIRSSNKSEFVDDLLLYRIRQEEIRTLADATGQPLEDFYEEFRTVENNDCFVSPIDIWN